MHSPFTTPLSNRVGGFYQSTVLLLCTLAFFVTAFARLALSPLVPLITTDLEISNAGIGIALSGMWAAYSLTQLPSGLLADRYGERSIILVALAGTGLTSVMVAFAPVFVVFVFGAVLLGAVGGLHYSAATALLSRTYKNTGMAIGIHNIGMPAGGLIAPVLASWVGVRYGWRPATVLVLALAIPIGLLFARYVRSREPAYPDTPIRNRLEWNRLVRILTPPPVQFSVVIGIVGMFISIGLFTFLPTFLVEHADYQPTVAGAIFTAFFVVLVPLQVVVGHVSDRIGHDRMLAVCFFAGFAGVVLLIFESKFISLTGSILLIAISSSSIPVVDSRLVDSLSGDDVGTEFGLPRTIYGILGGFGSVIVGFLADAFSWTTSFGFLAGISLAVAVLIWVNDALSLGY